MASIRYPAVAGAFYAADPARLRESVQSYLDGADVTPAPGVSALVAPHAGFIYSGPTAGHAFARARGMSPGRVVLLGRSHRHRFEGVAAVSAGAFETPLGQLPVDGEMVRRACAVCGTGPSRAHDEEHCLEVLLPFVQVGFGTVPIVPLLFGEDPGDCHLRLGKALGAWLDPGDLVVASTDLSHYLTEEEANALDRATLDRVMQQDPGALVGQSEEGDYAMCGATAVVCAMAAALAREARAWRLLDYRTSAPVSGDYLRVVGYGALSMETAA